MPGNQRTLGWGLITITFLLVILGCGLYFIGQIGWAQVCFVFASGTAGAGIVLVVEEEK